jgi:hypothetical protein
VIEIHLDGKPVTKLQAARAVNVTGGQHVYIGEPDENGRIRDGIALGARSAYGAIRRPELGCGSFRADTPEEMRQQAQMILLAAEVAELAMMLAGEQEDNGEAGDDEYEPWCTDYDADYKLHGCELKAHAADKPHRDLLGNEWRESLQVPCPSVSNEGAPCSLHFGHFPAKHCPAGTEVWSEAEWTDAAWEASGPRKAVPAEPEPAPELESADIAYDRTHPDPYRSWVNGAPPAAEQDGA